jgi:hypothetical protein
MTYIRVLLCVVLLFFINSCFGDDQVVDHSYTERLESSKSKVVVGLILMIFTPCFLWMSEKQLVKYERLVSRCQIAVKEVKNPFIVLRKYQSLPVLVKGNTTARDFCGQVRDSELGYLPEMPAVRLKRVVEMYQWVESKKEEDKRTIYSYHKEWSQTDIDSESFVDSGHWNPHRQPNTYSTVVNADVVKIGAYTLIERQVVMMTNWLASPLRAIPSAALTGYSHLHPHLEQPQSPLKCPGRAPDSGEAEKGFGYLVFGGSISNPSVGTVRVRYEVIPEGRAVSTVAVQDQDSFRAFCEDDVHRMSVFQCCRSGGEDCDLGSVCSCCSAVMGCMAGMAGAIVGSDVLLLEERNVDTKTIFGDEKRQLQCRMMMVRVACYFLMSLGIYLTLEPIATLLSFVPFLGGIISQVLWIAALLLGCTFGMFVSSVAWVLYRPQILTGAHTASSSSRLCICCVNLFLCAVLLMVVGSVVWIWGDGDGSVATGKTLCALALVPFSFAVVQLVVSNFVNTIGKFSLLIL